jgi:hypothetical protein
LSFTLTAALAIVFLGEPLSLLKIVGLGLAFAAVPLLLGAAAGPQARPNTRAAVVHIATIAAGVGNLLYKIGLAHGSTRIALLAVQALVFVTLAAGFAAKAEGTLQLPRRTLAYAIPRAWACLPGFC